MSERSLKFASTGLEGAYLIEAETHEDERGTFMRVWSRDELAQHGLNATIAQSSVSRSPRRGTLRGLHFQRGPHEEAKLIRVIHGAIFDVIVDLRPESPTYRAWFGVELDADRGTELYVPEGFAHGFQTLTDDAEVLYMISHPYVPEAAAGVRWDDPTLGIEWPETDQRTISERDRSWPLLEPARPGELAAI